MNMRPSRRPWMIAGALVSVALLAPAAAATDGFSDVTPGSTHAAAIDDLVDGRVTEGCAPDEFCPRASVTREQMASFLSRAAPRSRGGSGVTALNDANGFDGVPAAVTVDATGTTGGTSTVTVQGTVTVFAEGEVVSCPCEVEAFLFRVENEDQGPSSWAQLPGEATGSGSAVTSLPVAWTVEVPSGTEQEFRVAVFLNDGSPGDARAEATISATTSAMR